MLDNRARPVSTKDHSVMESEMTRVVEYIFMFHGVNPVDETKSSVYTWDAWSPLFQTVPNASAKHPSIVL